MRRPWKLLFTPFCVLAALLSVFGCDPSGLSLSVDVRTDLVPGGDFVAVRAWLDGRQTQTDRSVRIGEDFLLGAQVAEFSNLQPGTHRLLVSLLDAGGRSLIERALLVTLQTDRSATVLISSDCVGIDCDEGLSCLGGQCVAETCETRRGSECQMDDACTEALDCPQAAMCAVPSCDEGVCFYSPNDTCGADEFCQVQNECRPLPEVPDGGSAALDAGQVSAPDGGATGPGDGGATGPGDGGATGPGDSGPLSPGDSGPLSPGGLAEPIGSTAVTLAASGQSLGVAGALAAMGLANGAEGIQLFDISNPSAPRPLGIFRNDQGGPQDLSFDNSVLGVEIVGNLAYLACYYGGFLIVDVSDPMAPTFVGALDIANETWAVTIADGLAYLLNKGSGLITVDVSVPSAPAQIHNQPLEGNPQAIELVDDRIYIVSRTAMQVIDRSTRRAPVLIDEQLLGTSLYGVDADPGGRVYVVDSVENNLRVIDATSVPFRVEHTLMIDDTHSLRQVAHDADRLLITGYSPIEGLMRTMALAADGTPSFQSVQRITDRPYDITLSGDLAWVVTGQGNLHGYLLSVAP